MTKSAADSRIEEIRSAVLKKREELSVKLNQGLSDLRSSGAHLADLEEMSEVQDTEATVEIVERGSEILEQVDRALDGIEAGTYGICDECGDKIGIDRLEALPFATQCIKCKREGEQRVIP